MPGVCPVGMLKLRFDWYIIGSKIISNANKHYSTCDSLKYCLCSDIVMHLSFFPNSSRCNPGVRPWFWGGGVVEAFDLTGTLKCL